MDGAAHERRATTEIRAETGFNVTILGPVTGFEPGLPPFVPSASWKPAPSGFPATRVTRFLAVEKELAVPIKRRK